MYATTSLKSLNTLVLVLCGLSASIAAPTFSRQTDTTTKSECRYLPGDVDWPSDADWLALNATVGGRLIKGGPLGRVCYAPNLDAAACSALKSEAYLVDPYLVDPVNVMSPFWLNDTCSPYAPFTTADGSGSCTMGNLALYAINVSGAADVGAGIRFAQAHNIRLTVKNTGHDYLGRSTGQGSLALWTHNLKDYSFFHYSSDFYNGPAVKMGAGAQGLDNYEIASQKGLQVVGGSCPTVGAAGGWIGGGGHGPLTSAYGLGADNTLEFEVVTADGRHVIAMPSNEYSDLYWALSGGGPGNYAVVLSVTLKAHQDGPVTGASFAFANTDPTTYWRGVKAWLQHLLVLNGIVGLKTVAGFTAAGFMLNYATLPGGSDAQVNTALAPFFATLASLNITLLQNKTETTSNFVDHYKTFTIDTYTTNLTVAGRLFPSSFIADEARLDTLITSMSTMADQYCVFNVIANNVSHARVGNSPASNAVLPAWRDSLFNLAFGLSLDDNASRQQISTNQELVNQWQSQFRDMTPGSGAYINEATYDNVHWKEDYYGSNYDQLNDIKNKYDPGHTFWVNTAVGSDDYWTPAADGRLCRKDV